MPFEDADVELMLRYRDGDAAAFANLYALHKGPLYRYLLRHVRNAGAASDLFQEVWSRVIANRTAMSRELNSQHSCSILRITAPSIFFDAIRILAKRC